jgi:hypothetical protein
VACWRRRAATQAARGGAWQRRGLDPGPTGLDLGPEGRGRGVLCAVRWLAGGLAPTLPASWLLARCGRPRPCLSAKPDARRPAPCAVRRHVGGLALPVGVLVGDARCTQARPGGPAPTLSPGSMVAGVFAPGTTGTCLLRRDHLGPFLVRWVLRRWWLARSSSSTSCLLRWCLLAACHCSSPSRRGAVSCPGENPARRCRCGSR